VGTILSKNSEPKIKLDSSHEKTTTLKCKTMVNYLKRDFQLLGMAKTIFHPRLNYTSLNNLKIYYRLFFQAPLLA